jgi:hypothetical protein
VALLDRDSVADLPLHQGLGAVLRAVPGDVRHAAAHPHAVELELDAWRRGEGARKLEVELGEPVLDTTHRARSLVGE